MSNDLIERAKIEIEQHCPIEFCSGGECLCLKKARAVVALVLGEAANEASAYMSKTGFFDADSQAQLIGRTIRALGDKT